MPDDDRPPSVRNFVDGLNEARRAAGGPSYTEIEAVARTLRHPRKEPLPHSTVQGHLSGRRKRLPRWRMVDSLVTSLRIIAARNRQDPDDAVGTVDAWKARWEAAKATAECEHDEPEERDQRTAAEKPTLTLAAANLRPTGHDGPGGGAEEALHAYLFALADWLGTLDRWSPFHDVVPPWFAPYLGLEAAAQRIQVYEPESIPGLLQTARYAEEVVRVACRGDEEEVRRRVGLRMMRQEVLRRANAPRLWFVLDEIALRLHRGGRETMRAQIRHVLALSQRPNVTIQVMPMARSGHIAAGGPITLLRFAERDVRDVIYLERPHAASYSSDPEEIAIFGALFARLGIVAETPKATRFLLQRILDET